MDLPAFTEETLEGLFDPLTFDRAYDYLQRVSELRLTPGGALHALVQGSRPQPYATSVRLQQEDGQFTLLGRCSCPIGFGCHHMAAVLLAWESRRESPAQPRLSHSVQLWRNALAQAVAESQPKPPQLEQLLYLFSLDHAGRLRLTPQVAQRLRTGEWGHPHRFSGLYGDPPPFLRPEDIELLRRWQAMRSGPDEPLAAEWGGTILAAALATGRAYWQRLAGPPLVAGDPCQGEVRWQVDEQGAQRPLLQLLTTPLAKGVALPLLPLWYLDSEGGRVGPLSTTLPERVALQLLAAPPIAPEEAELITPELTALSQQLPAPLPLLERLPLEEQAGHPQPVLHLDGEGDPSARTIDFARLSFRYGDEEVALGRAGSAIDRLRAGRVVRIRRDESAEQAARLALERSGLHPSAGDGGRFEAEEGAWLRFLAGPLAELRRHGWHITEGAGFSLRLAAAGPWHGELVREGEQWFRLGLDVEVDGVRHPVLPLLLSALAGLPDLRQPGALAQLADDELLFSRLADGRVLPLAVGRVKPLLATLLELHGRPLGQADSLRLPKVRLPLLVELQHSCDTQWQGDEPLLALAHRLTERRALEPIPPPAGLMVQLRGYQQEGLNWLQFLRSYALGGILADDMGLGKTLQALAHLLSEKAAGRLDRPALLVAPTSLVGNWRREAAHYTPSLRVLALHGQGRQQQFGQIAAHDLVITTYPLLSRDAEVLLAQPFHLVILDEAQTIKNPRSKAAHLVAALNARHRLCLTGTPLENHLGELWSLFHFLMPGLLGEEAQFRRLFRIPIERQGNLSQRDALLRRIAPFILRRTKAKVAAELPAKTELVRSVELAGAQRELYEAVRLSMLERVQREISQRGLSGSRILVLDALLKLRQICCDPRLVDLPSARRVHHSAKLDLLLEMVPSMVAEGRRILIFSQFTKMLDIIAAALTQRGLSYTRLDGATQDRERAIARFQTGEVPLFLISLKAGGVGLNLTAADSVIHYDPWWNPAAERQATDRAHRLGQDKPVFVYRLIAAGTVEERIDELKARKQQLATALLESSAAGGGDPLSAEALAELLAPLE